MNKNPDVTHGEPTENPAGSDGSNAGVVRDTAVIAADINRHHELARASAITAVDHAKHAGRLLLEVKGSMQHGEWLTWLGANVAVSPRQAQRYIAVAQGRPAPIRELVGRYQTNAARVTAAVSVKSDTVSYLPPDSRHTRAPDWKPNPAFVPEGGMAYAAHMVGQGVREQAFFVEPSARAPGHWFVTHFFMDDEDDDSVVSTARPVRADFVEATLQHYGLQDPVTAPWRARQCDGVRIGLETVSTPEQVEVDLATLAKKETLPEAMARMERARVASLIGVAA